MIRVTVGSVVSGNSLAVMSVGLVLLVALLAGRLFEWLGQPMVVGEVIGGIALGPSVLGHFSESLFPPGARPGLQLLSTVGLLVFMFLMGLELDLDHFRRGGRRVAAGVAVWGSVVPFALGALLAVVVYQAHDSVDLLPFALFMGAAMSVTALPVLARILQERGMNGTPLGVVALACAVVDDVLTWVTLALVTAIVGTSSALGLAGVVSSGVAFTFGAIWVLRPALARYADRRCDPSKLLAVMVGILVCSSLTSAAGVHEIFGAFLFGAVFPRGPLADQLRSRLQPVALVLLPLFFVTVGLNVRVGGIGLSGLWPLVMILVVACTGKVLGAAFGAWSHGVRGRSALALGVLMNTRGLTELVVLDVGRTLGIIDDQLFTLLVLMAVITTAATGPLLRVIKPDHSLRAAEPGEHETHAGP